jgi:prepilin-type N-terminal cleavage/methylation domain-containing protein
MKNLQTNKGFTLVELLIVIAIALILVTVSVPIYGNLQVSAQLNENTSQMIQTVRIARVRSVARVNNASHGVYFEINPGADDRHILYQGDAYATRDMAYDRAVTLNPSLTLSTTLVGAEVNFSKGAGASTTTGTVTLTHDLLSMHSVW